MPDLDFKHTAGERKNLVRHPVNSLGLHKRHDCIFIPTIPPMLEIGQNLSDCKRSLPTEAVKNKIRASPSHRDS